MCGELVVWINSVTVNCIKLNPNLEIPNSDEKHREENLQELKIELDTESTAILG